ncbi:carboxymuconolactone decarboxylase family protein [Domibacillus iocasae]|uniref:carboxymuconolactone decarboxylase family protein n=1 Tax=Domibacillus iocasae TaxID=1714016 RepID=UPI00114CED93|nr:carboxymuconolactone decarboxylase family protein [Domibacillus iocasae]
MDEGWKKPVDDQMSDPLDLVIPDFRRWIIETYGGIDGRSHLDRKEWALIVISSLVIQGAHTQLATHINVN